MTKERTNPAVWVLKQAGDGIELRPVTVGAFADDAITSPEGLKDGERVGAAGVHKLNATDKVRI